MSTEEEHKVILDDPKDREILTSLLSEYSDKLISLCHQIEDQRLERKKRLIACIITIVLFAYVLIINPYFIKENFSLSSSTNFIFGGILGFILILFATISKTTQTLNRLRHEAKKISVKLEKIVRPISQIQDHVLNRFVVSLELDLRLTDAESALEYYFELTEKRRTYNIRRESILMQASTILTIIGTMILIVSVIASIVNQF
jgi:hypothetical protein